MFFVGYKWTNRGINSPKNALFHGMSYLFIEKRRKEKKITQAQAASILNISEVKTYRRRIKAAIDDLSMLANALDLTIQIIPNECISSSTPGPKPAPKQPIEQQPKQPTGTNWRDRLNVKSK